MSQIRLDVSQSRLDVSRSRRAASRIELAVSRGQLAASRIDFSVSQSRLIVSQSKSIVSRSELAVSRSRFAVTRIGPSVSRERRVGMTLKVSVGELLESLERKIAFHREQAAMHAREEELHRSQRTRHETELESAVRHFEALKAVAGPAAEAALSVQDPVRAEPVEPEQAVPDVGANPPLTTLIEAILKEEANGDPFGPTALTAEINRRFRDRLDREADVRSVSAALRRMCRKRRIERVREGRSYHEALYTRTKRQG